MSVDFEQPLLLALLPVGLALVALLWRSSHAYLPPVRRRLALVLRALVLSLLVLALASPLVRLNASDLAVAVLLDRSDSITPAAQAQEEQWLARALAAKGSQDRVAVLTFAGDAAVEQPLSTDSTPPRLSSATNLHPSRTNIAAAIRAGLGALPPDAARRLVLLTDGGQNVETADTAAALAAAAKVQLLTVPLQQDSGPEALVSALDAPGRLRQGDAFTATATFQSNVPQLATLYLLVDDRLASTQPVQLNQGVTRVVLPIEPLDSGHHMLRVQIEPPQDTLPQNNTAGAYVDVAGPSKILVLEGQPGDGQALADALRASGLQVDLRDVHASGLDAQEMRDYGSVVLADVAAADLKPSQMTGLKTYVQSYGGGLVVTGGDHAFGPGGYARTPLEDLLPVRMDLRGKSVSASTAMVLVMDISGSMGENVGGTTKMELAKQAAVSAAELLGEYDQIGVLAFDDQNHWMIRPTFANDLGPVESAISQMQPGGGTEIYPALREAESVLAPVDAKVKHIILLTDGEAPRGPYEDLARQMEKDGITLSTIGIGADADTKLLQELAQLGKGRYYDGNDPFDLPQLVVKETQQVQRAAIVEQDFRPRAVSSGPALEGIDLGQMPPLRGYVATTAKPQSTVLLASDQLDPVLSEWQYGLGRVVAWTSDVRNRWSSRWLAWPEFGRFWTQLVKRTTRPPEDPNRQVSVQVDGSQARVTLDAQSGTDAGDRKYLNFQRTTATVVDPRNRQRDLVLPQVAPGRYSATFPVEDDGVYALQVSQTDGDGNLALQSSGFVIPYSPEYRATATDQSLLESLARRTGGRVISEAEQAFVHDLPSVGAPRPIWPWLLAAAALLMVADVGVRRVRLSGVEVRAAYRHVRRSLGYVDERPARAVAPRAVAWRAGPSAAGVPGLVVGSVTLAQPVGGAVHGARPGATPATRSGRLLAAKQRAARR